MVREIQELTARWERIVIFLQGHSQPVESGRLTAGSCWGNSLAASFGTHGQRAASSAVSAAACRRVWLSSGAHRYSPRSGCSMLVCIWTIEQPCWDRCQSRASCPRLWLSSSGSYVSAFLTSPPNRCSRGMNLEEKPKAQETGRWWADGDVYSDCWGQEYWGMCVCVCALCEDMCACVYEREKRTDRKTEAERQRDQTV